MHTMYELLAQAKEQEVARNASHPSRLMAYDLRLARTTHTRAGDSASGAKARVPTLVAWGTRLAPYVVLAAGLAALT